MLYGMVVDSPGLRQAREFLRRCRPMARTSTFLIFDFTRGGPSTTPPDWKIPYPLPESIDGTVSTMPVETEG
jgi:hypothetical protein